MALSSNVFGTGAFAQVGHGVEVCYVPMEAREKLFNVEDSEDLCFYTASFDQIWVSDSMRRT